MLWLLFLILRQWLLFLYFFKKLAAKKTSRKCTEEISGGEQANHSMALRRGIDPMCSYRKLTELHLYGRPVKYTPEYEWTYWVLKVFFKVLISPYSYTVHTVCTEDSFQCCNILEENRFISGNALATICSSLFKQIHRTAGGWKTGIWVHTVATCLSFIQADKSHP